VQGKQKKPPSKGHETRKVKGSRTKEKKKGPPRNFLAFQLGKWGEGIKQEIPGGMSRTGKRGGLAKKKNFYQNSRKITGKKKITKKRVLKGP